MQGQQRGKTSTLLGQKLGIMQASCWSLPKHDIFPFDDWDGDLLILMHCITSILKGQTNVFSLNVNVNHMCSSMLFIMISN